MKSLSLTGGHVVTDFHQLEYGGHFPWDVNINEINTPDIDPSFFIDGPFAKSYANTKVIELIEDTEAINTESTAISEESTQHSLEAADNHFIDLSQLITESRNGYKEDIQNEFMDQSYTRLFATTCQSPTYQTLQSMPTTVTPQQITDQSFSSSSMSSSIPYVNSVEISTAMEENHNTSPLTASPFNSYEASASPNLLYLNPLSPALSFVSDSHTFISSSPQSEVVISDNNSQEAMDTKEHLMPYLQPTVINDHLYTRPSTPPSKSSTKDKKYMTIRKKNNAASKKSRVSKREKQKQMDEKIAFYISDNARCKSDIERMEKEIDFCKKYLFDKVKKAKSTS